MNKYLPGPSRLTLISSEKGRYGLYQCSCGNTLRAQRSNVNMGTTRSCGCLNKERARIGKCMTHGMTGTPTYQSWRSMNKRCYEPKNKDWPRYGGRGIVVCDKWRGSEGLANFVADMGVRPSGMSIDRIDNDGDYEPRNCKWSTQTQQQGNRSTSLKAEMGGAVVTLSQISRETGIALATLTRRYKCGDRGEELTRPLRWSTRSHANRSQ